MDESVYWYKHKTLPDEPLRGTTNSDVVVIGGGMAGLTCAQTLAGLGVVVTVLERDMALRNCETRLQAGRFHRDVRLRAAMSNGSMGSGARH